MSLGGRGRVASSQATLNETLYYTRSLFVYNVFMLDEGHFVYSIDRGNALGLMAGQAGQLRQKFETELKAPEAKFHLIVLAGMGGSALAAEFIRHWLSDQLTLPFII